MKSLAYDLAKSELDMLLDCAVCNQVTAKSVQGYQERVAALIAEAKLEAPLDEHEELNTLEATASTLLEQQVGRYDSILKPSNDTSEIYSAFASIPGAIVTGNSIAVSITCPVTLSRLNNSRLKRVLEAAEDVPRALHIIKSMSKVTASSVSYDLVPDSIIFLRKVVAGLSQDRTARALKKAFGKLL